MLNFRNINIAFLFALASMIVYDQFHGLPFYYYGMLIFIYLSLLFCGCYFIHLGFFIRSICSVKTKNREIAISFDDGPSRRFTPAILDVLKKQRAEAAFFCIGNRIPGNEAIIQRIHTEGHIIGNHSFSHHTWFDLFSATRMLADLKKMDSETAKIVGHAPRLFRPPYGVTNPNLVKAINSGHYISVGWNIRSMDTVIRDQEKLFRKVVRAIQPGAIILFHDTSESTLQMLPDFLDKVRAMGYQISRLDKMLNLNPYA